MAEKIRIAPSVRSVRRIAAVLATVCVAGLLTGFQASQYDSPPRGGGGAPAIVLPSKLIEAASIYEAYVTHAGAIDPGFKNAESVSSSLRLGETYDVHQMQVGIAAYAAIVALQDPTFVATVRGFGADPRGRAQVAATLVQDPRYATVFNGADSAAGLIVAALSAHGQRMVDVGHRVKQAAYDVQHQAWSKANVPDRDGRLALAKTLSSTPLTGAAEDEARLMQASTGQAPMNIAGAPAAAPYSPIVIRGLAAAAMAALGDGGEDFSDQIMTLLNEDEESQCFNMAKLNLYQCLAVAKPEYEDVFCLGEHALAETGQCIMKGATPVVAVAPVQVADATPAKPAKKAPVKRKKTVSH